MARIVLIDDEADLREMLAEVLASAGHETVQAENGVRGLEAVRRERPDLVLCDANMPELDGYGVLSAIRSDPQLASIPFLFLTGLGAPDQVRSGMSLGADDYLTKPVANDELLAAVNARLARREASRREADAHIEEMRRSVTLLLPHELRTPLTAILCAAQLIQSHRPDGPPLDVEKMAGVIVGAAQRLQRLVENYLLAAGLELQRLAGGAPAVGSLLGTSGAEEVREAADARAGEHGRVEDLRVDLDGSKVPAASPYVRKIVSELLDNAFKFSHAGSAVKVSLHGSDGMVTLEVEDEGRGMTPDQIRQVSAFRQFDRAIFEQQGSGLGLVLVRGIVEGSGGRFELVGGSRHGTRALVRWPSMMP